MKFLRNDGLITTSSVANTSLLPYLSACICGVGDMT